MFTVGHISDYHFSKGFSNEKLSFIEKRLDGINYVFITGDLIDDNQYIRENPKERDRLLAHLERLSLNNDRKEVVISLGNHDQFSKINNSWQKDWNDGFWKEINSIKGITVPYYEGKYEDNNIFVSSIDPGYSYYENNDKFEKKELLIDELKSKKEILQSIKSNKFNILLSHSPVYMTDEEVLNYIYNYDCILSGHMHNGLVFPLLDDILNALSKIPNFEQLKNIGIISPYKKLFPDNARGIKNIKYNDKELTLYISGGITTLVGSPLMNMINDLFYPVIIDKYYSEENRENTKILVPFNSKR